MYRAGAVVDEGFPATEIAGRLAADHEVVVWLDLHDPDVADLRSVVEEFGLHPLAVEDAVADRQRPKLDRYETHQFLNVYAAKFEPDGARLRTSEVSAFITDRALITVRKADFDVDTLVHRWDSAGHLAAAGVAFLLHGLLDAVVDGQYEAVDGIDNAIDDLEECLFERPQDADVRVQGFQLRKALVQLRRVVLPMREVVRQLLRPALPHRASLVTEELAPYYRDVYDHVMSTAEGVENARDLVNSVLDTSFNEQSYTLNDITKKLASWAAIIAVPTAVTGFYGMNVPYPGFSREWGFVTAVVVMLLLASGLYVMLRRWKWL
jgi:magnesium transporter